MENLRTGVLPDGFHLAITQTLVTLANLSLRVHGRFVTLADDRGRVVALERQSLAVVSSFTVS